jgi:phage shock protein PspC (stress-responsive transcriptional regulator)
MQVNRRLYRCRENRLLGGVAAGVAEYFDLDPTLVRVLWFLSIFFGGLTILVYIGLAIIVPLEPVAVHGVGTELEGPVPVEGHRHTRRGTGQLATLIGIALIFFGALALIEQAAPGLVQGRYLWPIVVLAVGAALIARGVRREPTEP